jgi:molybdopterin-guanine dinucleotide biosynthesis protein A
LCAIYEPQTHAAILAQIAADRHCPRKFVISTGVALLEQPDPSLLDNLNTPDELELARAQLTSPALREREIDTSPASAGEVGRKAG